jgi:hypothetical protein
MFGFHKINEFLDRPEDPIVWISLFSYKLSVKKKVKTIPVTGREGP